MNKEEAIERLKYIDMAYNCNNYYSKYDLDCIETVLQLLKEQDNKIKFQNEKIEDAMKWLNMYLNQGTSCNCGDLNLVLNILEE